MRALLFNPWITDFAAFDHWARPLNLLRLAALLRQQGWIVDFYDCLDRRSPDLDGLPAPPRHRFNPYGGGHYYREIIPNPPLLESVKLRYKRYGVPPGRVEQRLRTFPRPDVIIVASVMTYWYPGVFEAIARLRRLFPGVPILLGGIYATLCRAHAEAHSGADAVITGRHWPEIVNRIFALLGDASAPCPGDQETWIEPAYDLMCGDSCYPLLTSTGCPGHCTYCATHSLWPRFVTYDRDAVLDSIGRLARDHHATDLVFYDDALLVKKETHFLPLMEALIHQGYSLRFHTPNALHVRQIDATVAGWLKRAGFATIRLGLEVVQRDWQKSTGGKVYLEEYLAAMRHLRDAGFTREVGTYLLFGLPGQSLEAVREGCRLVAEQGSEIYLALYSPIPGTPLYERPGGEFRFAPRGDPLFHNNSLAPWQSPEFTETRYRELRQFARALNEIVRKGPFFGVPR
ncbi:MAG: radical SAM protein [bacterium]